MDFKTWNIHQPLMTGAMSYFASVQKAYCLFCKQFAGQSKRSFLEKWSACPNSFQVISPQVLQCAHKYLEDYNYPGEALLALSIDDTKLLPAFQPYFDHRAGKWFLVGNAGKPLEVQDIDKHADQIDCAWELLTTKLWLWVLQIPLCCVPPLILAYHMHPQWMPPHLLPWNNDSSRFWLHPKTHYVLSH